MTNKDNQNSAPVENTKISWMGIDGFLVILFIVLAVFIGFCVIHNVDLVIGILLPYGVTLATLLIFIRYFAEVFSFSRRKKK